MIRKGETVLSSLEQWARLAGPKSPVQWQDHRSAKESARAWMGQRVPPELIEVLCSHEHFGEILEWEAEPECLVRFDEYGGPANIDVMLSGRDEHDRFVMAVEAKADESFGPLVSRALAAALERRLVSASSNGLKRLVELAGHLVGPAREGQPKLHRIRYQLLTASAAALSRAKEEAASRAVVMIHEFDTPRTKQENRERNAQDLVRFLERLGVKHPLAVLEGQLLGPIRVPGGARFEDPAPLYVGKGTRRIRQDERE